MIDKFSMEDKDGSVESLSTSWLKKLEISGDAITSRQVLIEMDLITPNLSIQNAMVQRKCAEWNDLLALLPAFICDLIERE